MNYPVLYSDGTRGESDPLIYGLVDPRESERIRYVGKTIKPLWRYMAHCRGNKGSGGMRWATWIQMMARDGVRPTMILLERVSRTETLRQVESGWINRLQAIGQADLNGMDRETGKRVGRLVRESFARRKAEKLVLDPVSKVP